MRLDEIRPGDVLTYWWDTGAMGCAICYAKVIRVGRVFVTWEHENGATRRTLPHHFNRALKSHEWSPWNPEGN